MRRSGTRIRTRRKDFCWTRLFRQGFACLHKLGLSFDAWMYHTQLADLVDLAQAFPDATIILDHIGGPLGIGPYAGKQDEVMQVWKKGLAALAGCQNVVVKLGRRHHADVWLWLA